MHIGDRLKYRNTKVDFLPTRLFLFFIKLHLARKFNAFPLLFSDKPTTTPTILFIIDAVNLDNLNIWFHDVFCILRALTFSHLHVTPKCLVTFFKEFNAVIIMWFYNSDGHNGVTVLNF